VDAERHPAADLVERIAEALLAADAPSRRYSPRVYHLDDPRLVPEEAQGPFYGITVGQAAVTDEQADRLALRYEVQVGAYQYMVAPAPGGREAGLKPHAPAARVGVLDLVWAAHQVLRGRGLGEWAWAKSLGETASEALVSPDGETLSGWVRRALRIQYAVASEFEPQ